MNPTILLWFAFALWLVVVLTGCSFMAMGLELRWRGVPVKWWSFSFSFKQRIETFNTVIREYRTFKRDRYELPIFLWLMAVFSAGIVIVPILALIMFLAGK